jgi:hypothetical protein
MQHARAALRRRCTERTVFGSCGPSMRPAAPGLAFCLVAAIAVACGGSDRGSATGHLRSADSGDARAAATLGDSRADSTSSKPICPATGQWQLCSVLERLDRAGLAPRQDSGRVTEPPLTSSGVAIRLGRSELRIFLYADRAARERDQATLDSGKYVSASAPLSMKVEPTLITTENLLAILRSRSDHQRERVSDALTAGPPQRPGTKG